MSDRTEQPNWALIEEIDRIALREGFTTSRNEADWRNLGLWFARSSGALTATYKGGEPKASTLLALARKAGANPLRLYFLAGWFDDEDVRSYVSEMYASRIREARNDPATLRMLLSRPAITEEELRVLADVTEPVLALLEQQRIARARLLIGADDIARPGMETDPGQSGAAEG